MAHAEATVVRAGRGGDPGDGGSDLQRLGGRFHRRAVRARARRSGQLSGVDQGRRRVVPEDASARSPPASSTPAPTSARLITPLVVPCDHAARGAGTGRSSRPASLGFFWLVVWWRLLRAAGVRTRSCPAPQSSRTFAAIRRIRRSRRAVAHAAAASPDLGVRARQVHDRPGLVAVSVLDSGFPEPQLRDQPVQRSDRRSS